MLRGAIQRAVAASPAVGNARHVHLRRWMPLAAAPARSLSAAPKISAQTVKELRDKTGSPMMDCKRALEESGGDQAAALDFLRKKGMATAAKKESRRSADGLVAVHVAEGGKRGSLIELNSETDFVAKNPVFQQLAVDIAALRVSAGAEIDVEKFKADFKLASGPKSSGAVAVGEAVKEMVATVGENCQLRKTGVVEVKEGIISKYIHTPMGTNVGKLGVLVAIETSSTDAKQLAEIGTKLAMHVAASSPLFLTVADVSKDAEDKERAIFMAQAEESGKKPEHAEKMVTGRIRKWHQEIVLMEQEFLIGGDSEKKQSVGKFLEESGKVLGAPIAVTGFLRVKCGESE